MIRWLVVGLFLIFMAEYIIFVGLGIWQLVLR